LADDEEHSQTVASEYAEENACSWAAGTSFCSVKLADDRRHGLRDDLSENENTIVEGPDFYCSSVFAEFCVSSSGGYLNSAANSLGNWGANDFDDRKNALGNSGANDFDDRKNVNGEGSDDDYCANFARTNFV